MRISDGSSDVCSSALQAHDLAQVRLHVLRRRHLLALAGADPQLAETVEGDAVAVVRATADLGRLPPDHLQVGQAATVAGVQRQRRARHRGAARVAVALLCIADVDQPVAGEPRMRRSEEHTSELQSLMRISYAVFCLKTTKTTQQTININHT